MNAQEYARAAQEIYRSVDNGAMSKDEAQASLAEMGRELEGTSNSACYSTVRVEIANEVHCAVCSKLVYAMKSPYICYKCWETGKAGQFVGEMLTALQNMSKFLHWAQDGADEDGMVQFHSSFDPSYVLEQADAVIAQANNG